MTSIQPELWIDRAVSALAFYQDAFGARVGRIVDPFGHEWEIGRPLGAWPPS